MEDALVECACVAKKKQLRLFADTEITETMVERYSFAKFNTDRPKLIKAAFAAVLEYAHDYQQIKKRYEGNSIYLGGNPGSGKTHLLSAAFIQIVKNGERGLYFRYAKEWSKLKGDVWEKDRRYLAKTEQLMSVPLLFIDDFLKATFDKPSSFEKEFLHTVIDHRYENGMPTMFSSEYTIDQLINEYDEGIGSRIKQMSKGLNFKLLGSELNHRMEE